MFQTLLSSLEKFYLSDKLFSCSLHCCPSAQPHLKQHRFSCPCLLLHKSSLLLNGVFHTHKFSFLGAASALWWKILFWLCRILGMVYLIWHERSLWFTLQISFFKTMPIFNNGQEEKFKYNIREYKMKKKKRNEKRYNEYPRGYFLSFQQIIFQLSLKISHKIYIIVITYI